LNPAACRLPENMQATPVRSPVGARNPSTRTAERFACERTCPASSAVAWPSNGRSRRVTRETVACEQPNNSAATAWDSLRRNRNRVNTTARYKPNTRRLPRTGCHTPPSSPNTAVTSSAT
jgi:hypothetical protein